MNERRERKRYPVETELTYSTPGAAAAGKGFVTDLSGSGIAFRGDLPVAAGTMLEVRVAWPGSTTEQVFLNAVGEVVRTAGDLAAIRIQAYAFVRGRSRRALRLNPVPPRDAIGNGWPRVHRAAVV